MSSTQPRPAAPPSDLSARSPADLLSYVQHAIGFTPTESLVVMTTSRNRLGATLRVDLPRVSTPDADTHDFAEAVLSFLRGDREADGVLVAIYTNEEWTFAAPPPREALVRELRSVLGAAGLPVRSAWYVSADVWRDLSCTNEDCCPWPGHPLDTIADSQVNAEMIFGGSAFDPSASEAVLRAAPDVGRDGSSDLGNGEIEEAQAFYAAACASRWMQDPQFMATSCFWDAVLEQSTSSTGRSREQSASASRRQRDGEPIDGTARRHALVADPDVAGFLLASLESRFIRDFLLVSACLGSTVALEGSAVLRTVRGDPNDEPARRGTAHVLPAVAEGIVRHEHLRGGTGGSRPSRSTAWHGATQARSIPGSSSADFHAVLAGTYTGTPDWGRVDRMASLLAQLAPMAGASGEARAAVLTMLGWIEYARGRGSRAGVFLDAAERSLPGYRLARLLNELLHRGGLPEWATVRSTAWTAHSANAGRGRDRAA